MKRLIPAGGRIWSSFFACPIPALSPALRSYSCLRSCRCLQIYCRTTTKTRAHCVALPFCPCSLGRGWAMRHPKCNNFVTFGAKNTHFLEYYPSPHFQRLNSHFLLPSSRMRICVQCVCVHIWHFVSKILTEKICFCNSLIYNHLTTFCKKFVFKCYNISK